MRSAAVALVAAILSSACQAGDDVIRAGARYADELARATHSGDDIARMLTTVDGTPVARSKRRVESISARFELPAETRPAFQSLVWNVGCDVVSGKVASTPDGIARMLAYRSAEFGLEFTGDDGAQMVAGPLLDAFGQRLGIERNDAVEACSRLRTSGS